MKPISYTRTALKALRRIPKPTATLIRAKIEQFADDPDALANNVTALKGSSSVRLRVGDWRVIMEDGVVLYVQDIGPRGGIYG
jgi:mRNA interferase RelE/StbE